MGASRPALEPTQPLIQWYRLSFPGVKRPERGGNHPPTSNAEVKETVELYIYSPSGPSWPVLWRNVYFLVFTDGAAPANATFLPVRSPLNVDI